MIILVDYDGTCIWQLPEPGYTLDEVPRVVEVLNRLVRIGHKIILWTARNDSPDNPFNYFADGEPREETSLGEAVRWFHERNILLSGINGYNNEVSFVGTSRKIHGDLLIDDLAVGVPRIYQEVDYIRYQDGDLVRNYRTHCVDWRKVEEILIERGIMP